MQKISFGKDDYDKLRTTVSDSSCVLLTDLATGVLILGVFSSFRVFEAVELPSCA